MKVGDLVKVRGAFIEEYALIVEIFQAQNTEWIMVKYFDGEEELMHPSQITKIFEQKT